VSQAHRIRAICPCCENEIYIEIHPRLDGIYKAEDSTEESRILVWRNRLTDSEKAMLDSAKTVGILNPMIAALEKANGPKPSNPEKYFLNFMRLAAPINIPKDSLALLTETFPGQIQVLQYQNLVGIVADQQLVMFAPLAYVGPSKNGIKCMVPTLPYRTLATDWIKTRMGYVPMGARVFGKEIRGKRFGDFGKIVQ
jgi:hypothetical protein